MSTWQPVKPAAGQSILAQLRAELDVAYARLQLKGLKHKHTQKGVVVGLARAIAVMTNPYAPDIDGVRIEAEERYRNAKSNKRSRKARAS